MACPIVPGVDNLASSLVAYVDCQTINMASRGYGALTGGEGLVPSLLLTLLTLYIALWGYRLLTGDRPGAGDLLSSFARIAVVLTLASSWLAYQRLVYDVVLQTPAQIAGTIDFSETGDDGAGLAARLDDVDARFVRLAIFGTGSPRTPEEAAFARANVPPSLFLNFDSFALGSARLVFLVSAVGSFALVRLLSGGLLALGPLIVMFLLFDMTRGLVAGWGRALAGLVAAGILTILVIDIETVLLIPWLSDLLAMRGAEQPIYGAPVQLLAAAIIFCIVIFAAIRLSQRLVVTVWPAQTSRSAIQQNTTASIAGAPLAMAAPASTGADHAQRRAQAVAEAITVSDHRRTRLATAGGRAGMASAAGLSGIAPASPGGTSPGGARSTSSSGRRSAARGSASSTQRDRR